MQTPPFNIKTTVVFREHWHKGVVGIVASHPDRNLLPAYGGAHQKRRYSCRKRPQCTGIQPVKPSMPAGSTCFRVRAVLPRQACIALPERVEAFAAAKFERNRFRHHPRTIAGKPEITVDAVIRLPGHQRRFLRYHLPDGTLRARKHAPCFRG